MCVTPRLGTLPTGKNNKAEFKEGSPKTQGGNEVVTPKQDDTAENIHAEPVLGMHSGFIAIDDVSYSDKHHYGEDWNSVEEIAALKKELQRKDEIINILKAKQSQLEHEREDILLDLGELSVENDFKSNTSGNSVQFQQIFRPNTALNSTAIVGGHVQQSCLALPSTSRQLSIESDKGSVAGESTGLNKGNVTQDSANNLLNATNVPEENLKFAVEVTERSEAELINLSRKPSSLVAASVYNNYKLLLFAMSYGLLSSEIVKLKEWANETFSVQTNLTVTKVIFQMDQEGVINAFDLNPLRVFFEKIFRYDLVCLIDEFYKGEYGKLWNLVRENKSSFAIIESRNQQFLQRANNNMPAAVRNSLRPTTSGNEDESARVLERPRTAEQNDAISVPKNNQRVKTGHHTKRASEPKVNNTRGRNIEKLPTQRNNSSPRQSEGHFCGRSHNEDNRRAKDGWLCGHYKRKCFVKFDCCEKYWPCHRCHNNESTCGNRKLKSRDTSRVKCVKCSTEQEFGQFCVTCNTQFSTFFCGLCKHLTGRDDYPYHCDKCGICRINGDRSFHCDVCGVCLDVQLRGNHKCRPDSAHDECCICLEDAFTGCQILPCSHKVHKECATRMIRSGITRCPICRESFAHMLERRTPSKKTLKRR